MGTAASRPETFEVDEWPGEDQIAFAVGLAAEQIEPLDGVPELLKALGCCLGQPQLGSTRACFTVGEKWVLKVPLTWQGESANFLEADHVNPDIPLAQCRLHESSHGPVLLWMRRVKPVTYSPQRRLPAWTNFVDCAQVGYMPDGRLVAYDL